MLQHTATEAGGKFLVIWEHSATIMAAHTVTYLTATHCNTLQQEVVASVLSSSVGSLDPSDCNTLQHTGAGGKFLVIVSGRTLDPSLASSS